MPSSLSSAQARQVGVKLKNSVAVFSFAAWLGTQVLDVQEENRLV